MATGGQVYDPTIFQNPGQDAQPQGQNGQDNWHPTDQDWQQKPYTQKGYNPHMEIHQYAACGKRKWYDPVLCVESDEHPAGHHHYEAPNSHGSFKVGEHNEITGSHHRPVFGGHQDVNYVCHQRINWGGGVSMTCKGDSAMFWGGNHSSHISGSHSHEVAGHQRTRINGNSSHSTHDPQGNMMAMVSHTQDNSWFNNVSGNFNINAGNNAQKPEKGNNGYLTSQGNTSIQVGQNYMANTQGNSVITTKGSTMDTSTGNHTTKSSGQVILQNGGSMSAPPTKFMQGITVLA